MNSVKFIVDSVLLQEVADYLSQKPWFEVRHFMQALQNLEVQKENIEKEETQTDE